MMSLLTPAGKGVGYPLSLACGEKAVTEGFFLGAFQRVCRTI